MRFELIQRFAADPDRVAAAFCDPAYYEALAEVPALGHPEVLSAEAEGEVVHLKVRYRFTGELSSAARAVLDPARLTWVEDSRHDLGNRSVTFKMVADHYADRFTSNGRYRFDPVPADPNATVRHAEGEVKVRAPLVGASVERAIVSGLKSHLADEVTVMERFLARQGPSR